MNDKLLEFFCLADIEALSLFLIDNGFISTANPRPIWFKGSPNSTVLAVAHLDVVNTFPVTFEKKDKEVTSVALDDRLGAFVIFSELMRLGIDVLFTTDEELGQSSASSFETTKQYNWMFSFDRHGEDVVMYQYHEFWYNDFFKLFDFPSTSFGSYSDIASLDKLHCIGFNFGVGYYGEHSPKCHANLDIVIKQLSRWYQFYLRFKDIKFPYVSRPKYGRYNHVVPTEYYHVKQIPAVAAKPKEHPLFKDKPVIPVDKITWTFFEDKEWTCLCPPPNSNPANRKTCAFCGYNKRDWIIGINTHYPIEEWANLITGKVKSLEKIVRDLNTNSSIAEWSEISSWAYSHGFWLTNLDASQEVKINFIKWTFFDRNPRKIFNALNDLLDACVSLDDSTLTAFIQNYPLRGKNNETL